MLYQRIAIALIGVPIAIILTAIGGAWLTCALTIIAIVGLWELYSTLAPLKVELVKETALPCACAFLWLTYLSSNSLDTLFIGWSVICFVLIFATLIYQMMHPQREHGKGWRITNVGITIFSTLYVALLSFAILLREMPGEVKSPWLPDIAMPLGARLLLFTIAISWLTDASAYFGGRWVGKRPLAMWISPGKTIEGAILGWLIGTGVSCIVGVGLGLQYQHAAVIAAILAFTGQVGDLCESIIKRDLGVKDFSSFIPGHGGILDRFDSLLINLPLAYFLVHVMNVTG
ncbi:MAG TPA: hypothetical protein EYP10_13215 [Armatimonadetes bacterium]|nr:hypothetical protein [Armatimonadota bacterium]